jgi:membrane-bound metal-dependent hydrolase YbcI (DUF457 family)
MFIFAHIGITLGAATLVSGIVAKFQTAAKKSTTQINGTEAAISTAEGRRSEAEILGLKTLTDFMDIRLLALGSMFPDIIDKPLEFIGFGSGRSITHTLLITLVVLLTGLFVFLNYKQTGVLAIAIGMVSHLIIDSMWRTPEILFWPLYGWGFQAGDGFLLQISMWWSTLMANPTVIIYEGIGLFILLASAWILMGNGKFRSLLIRGKI